MENFPAGTGHGGSGRPGASTIEIMIQTTSIDHAPSAAPHPEPGHGAAKRNVAPDRPRHGTDREGRSHTESTQTVHSPASNRQKPYTQYDIIEPPFMTRRIGLYQPLKLHVGAEVATPPLYHFGRIVLPTGEIEPVGYCAAGCPGHADKDEARAHFARYLLDFGGFYCVGSLSCLPRPCAVCGRETNLCTGFMLDEAAGLGVFALCRRTQTRITFGACL